MGTSLLQVEGSLGNQATATFERLELEAFDAIRMFLKRRFRKWNSP